MSEKPTDVRFEIAKDSVWKAPAHRACRRAVLYPLVGRDKRLQTSYEKLYRLWRLQLVLMRDAGWKYLNADEHRLAFTRNCPPFGVTTTKFRRLMRCRQARICPCCYARDVVLKACVAFEVAVPALRVTEPTLPALAAFRRVNRLQAPAWSLKTILEKVQAPGYLGRDLHPLGHHLLGGVLFTGLSPLPDGDGWQLVRSGVVLLDSPDLELPVTGKSDRLAVRYHDTASVTKACRMVGWAATYPTTMFARSNLEMTVDLLHTLAASKLCQVRFFGALRNAPARRRRLSRNAKMRDNSGFDA